MSTQGTYGRTRTEAGFVNQPVLHVPLHVWQRLTAFIQVCPTEVNGFGYLDRTGDRFYLDDVFILEQTATPTGVEVTAEALARHLYELARDGGNAGRMRFQWHSHVNMEAYFSGTDLDNIEHYNGDWMISLVGNKHGDYELRLDVFRPFRVWTPIELRVTTILDPEVVRHCSEEVGSKVRQQGTFRRPLVKPVPANGVNLEGHALVGEE